MIERAAGSAPGAGSLPRSAVFAAKSQVGCDSVSIWATRPRQHGVGAPAQNCQRVGVPVKSAESRAKTHVGRTATHAFSVKKATS
jgi:hypothetical protein